MSRLANRLTGTLTGLSRKRLSAATAVLVVLGLVLATVWVIGTDLTFGDKALIVGLIATAVLSLTGAALIVALVLRSLLVITRDVQTRLIGTAERLASIQESVASYQDSLASVLGESFRGFALAIADEATRVEHSVGALRHSLDEISESVSVVQLIPGLSERLDQNANLLTERVSQATTDLKTAFTRGEEHTAAELAANYLSLEGLLTVYRSLDLGVTLPSLEGWAIGPDTAAVLVRAIERLRPSWILEAGSGVSSVILGAAASRYGAKVVTLEHDAYYAAETQALVDRHGLSQTVHVIHAPLVTHDLKNETWRWYNTSQIPEASAFGVVFIDGPPGNETEHARYPALPLLQQWLAPDGALFLDDASRSDERDIIDRWLTESPSFTARLHDTRRGLAELTRKR